MADCSNKGFSGDGGFTFDGVHELPSNVECYVTGFTQASLTQTVTVYDGNGNQVGSITGSGFHQSLGSFHFEPTGGQPYRITFKNSGSQDSRVMYGRDSISSGTTTYGCTWTFQTDDIPSGGDCDFNDSIVIVSWCQFPKT